MSADVADRVVNATLATSVALGAVTLTDVLQLVQIIAGGLSIIGLIVSITYYSMKISRMRKGQRED